MRTSLLKYVGIVFVLLPMVVMSVFPLVIMITTSFKTMDQVYAQPTSILPTSPTIQAYFDIWSVANLAAFFRNSLFVGLGSTLLCLLMGIPAGYALARFRFRGRAFYMVFLLVMQMFPGIVIILALYRVVAMFQMTDNLVTLVILNAAFGLSFAVWLLTGYFATVPPEVEEAAMVDGNSRLGAMMRITLPLSAPGLVAVGIFSFIGAWNEFLFALTFIRSQDKLVLTVGLWKYIAKFQVEWNLLEASSFLVTIVVVVLFMLVQKNLTRGLIAGADR
jgi:multiple sugar transport system permease protein